MPSGGYRKPANPAPVSGPGALSQRTDGGPTQPARYISGLPYGQGQTTMAQQTSAPLAGNPSADAQAGASQMLPAVTPLTAPTERPNEPLTHGMDFGPGAGSEALNLPQERSLSETLATMIPFDSTGEVQTLYDFVSSRGL